MANNQNQTSQARKLVPLVDVLMQAAISCKITSVRKGFWEFKKSIEEAIENGQIKGKLGREILLDPVDLEVFLKNKRAALNIQEPTVPNNTEDLKRLIEKLRDNGFSHTEILMIVCHRLGISLQEGKNEIIK